MTKSALVATQTVTATSSDGSTSTQAFTVNLTDDTSEFAVGAVSDSNAAANSVSESAANGTVVGITALASDADGTDTVSYSLSDTAGGRFAIDAGSGVITVADTSLLDYETATSHSVTVTATSSDGSTSSQGFTVNLGDVNDAPVATGSLASMEQATPITGVLTAGDVDNSPADLSYSLDTGPANGAVTVGNDGSYTYTPDVSYVGADSFTFRVTDSGGLSDTATVSIDILAKVPDLATGSEFQVHTATAGNQTLPSAAALGNGGFVVTWASADAAGKGIFAQLHDATGNTVGSEFQVNSYTLDNQDRPSVTPLQDGGFLVVWDSKNQDGDGKGVFGQRYDSDGNAVGSEFQINTDTAGNQERPMAEGLADGGFVVTWASADAAGKGIFAQLYDATGNTVGSEFQVNSYTADNQDRPEVTALKDGGFLVVWDSKDQDGSGKGVFGQRYDASGNTVGSEFQINTDTVDNQKRPTLAALGDGGFAVVWEAWNVDGSGKGVFGQRYDSGGNTVGSEFQVNDYTPEDQKEVSITILQDGSVVETWQSNSQDGDGQGIYAKHYLAVSTGPHTFTGGDGNDSFIGGDLDDTLLGAAGDDFLEGGGGADTLNGGVGTDTASYSGSGAGVTVSLATGTGSGGDAQGDTLISIENLIGSNFDDTLTGDANANVLSGGAGNDMLVGGAGADFLDGGAGLDSLIGGDDDDILLWDAADTAIDGGTGTDTLRVDSGDADLTTFGGTIQGIEQVDLQTDVGANSLTLTAADVLSMSDTDILTVDGDAGDGINAGTGWTDGGIAGGYHTYTQGLAILLVDTDMTVNADITS